ncbi:MAG: antibiotic biosynthesis monooxygenase [Acidobacteriota bacterium]
MYMRFLQLNVRPEALELSRNYYRETVLPRLHAVKGCLFAHLIQDQVKKTELISMTLWEKKEDAEEYQNSPVFKQLMAEFSPYLDESNEWKIQLSDKMELEYKPVSEEPVIQSFPVFVQENLKLSVTSKSSPMYVRILSHKLQKGKLKEFEKLYKTEVIPALQKTEGCLYAYLMENLKDGEEVISVTIWENGQAAEEYEKSGTFNSLTDKIKHTFSRLYQWKMELSKEPERKAVTSDDTSLSKYTIVTGKRFK